MSGCPCFEVASRSGSLTWVVGLTGVALVAQAPRRPSPKPQPPPQAPVAKTLEAHRTVGRDLDKSHVDGRFRRHGQAAAGFEDPDAVQQDPLLHRQGPAARHGIRRRR